MTLTGYVIYGVIKLDGVVQNGVNVTVRNDTKSQEHTVQTNSLGEYNVTLTRTDWYPSGCDDGDTIKVTSMGATKTITINATTYPWGVVADINLFEIVKDAVSKGTAQQAPETTFNLLKDALGKASATPIINVDFNVTKDVIVQVLDSVAVEVVIVKDAITKVSAAENFESLFNLTKDAIAKSGAAAVIQTQGGIPKDALATASASVIITTVSGLIEIYEDALAHASVSGGGGIFDRNIFDANIFDVADVPLKIETTFNVSEGAVVKVDASNLIQSIFNVAGDVIVKVLADAFVEALHLLVEIYKFANVTASADLATQTTLNVVKDAAQKAATDLLLQSIFNQELSSSAKAMATVVFVLANWSAFKLITKSKAFEPLTVLGAGFSPLTIKSKSFTPLIVTGE